MMQTSMAPASFGSTFQRLRTSRWIDVFLVVFFIMGFGYRYQGRAASVWDLNSDPKVNATFAVNLMKNGTFSADDISSPPPHEPSAYRMPVYPAFLAICMKISPNFSFEDHDRSITLKGFPLSFYQAVLAFLFSLISGIVVFLITRSRMAAYLVLFLVGLDNTTMVMATAVLPEIIVCFLLLLFSLCLVIVRRQDSFWAAATGGMVLSILVLTRGQFEYFIFIGIVVWLWLLWRQPAHRRRQIISACLLFILPLAAAQLWKYRNLRHFDRYYMTDRGGLVLDARAEYNMMSYREFLAAFVYYLAVNNGPDFRDKLSFFRKSDFARLHTFMGNPQSLEVKARQRRSELVDRYGDYTRADEVQMKEAIAKIRAHPFRHIIATFPFAYRGTFAKQGIRGPLLFSVMIIFFCWAVVRGHMSEALFLLPAVFSFAFVSFVSPNEPRFNIPLVPFVYMATVLTGWHFAKWLRNRSGMEIPARYNIIKQNPGK